MLRAVAREWLSWVYPFVCELCGRGGLDGCHVCPDCRGSFVPVEPPFCAVCGEPADYAAAARRFSPLLRKPVPCM